MRVATFVLCVYLILNLLAVHIAAQYQPTGTPKKCIHAAAQITARGDGSTEDSCMGCDPALPTCSSGCQKLIGSFYEKCEAVCMPDGYYYDPLSTITGCWDEVKPLIKVGVERCGCDSAAGGANLILSLVASAIILCTWVLM